MPLLPFLLLVFPSLSEAQGPVYRNIGQGVYTFAGDGLLYTSVFVVTTAGVIVVDPMSTSHATQMLAAIQEVSSQPVSYVAYSHNHWDHTGGAAVFQPRNIIAHKKAAAWIAANPKPDGSVLPPTITWSGNTRTMRVGNQTLEMKHLGANHGQGWTAFILKEQRIAYMADLTSPGSLAADGHPTELARTLRDLLALPGYDTIVASHSGMENIKGQLTKDYVQAALDYIMDLRAEVLRQVGLLTRPEEIFSIPFKLDLPKYQDTQPYKTFIVYNAWNILAECCIVGPPGKAGVPEGAVAQSSSTTAAPSGIQPVDLPPVSSSSDLQPVDLAPATSPPNDLQPVVPPPASASSSWLSKAWRGGLKARDGSAWKRFFTKKN